MWHTVWPKGGDLARTDIIHIQSTRSVRDALVEDCAGVLGAW